MTRRLRLVAPLVAAAVAAAGCSSDGDQTDSSASAPETSVAGEAGGPTTVAPVADPGDSMPAESSTSEPEPEPEPEPDVASGVQPDGFTTATVRITTAAGEVCEVCMWLADDGPERGRGLMGVTDLGEPAGMAFVFPQPVEGAFYMFGTPTPLSIAWFAPDGAFVSATDMEPCLGEPAAACPHYGAGGPYQLAIEAFAGGLDDLGLGPGSTAEVLAGTESAVCAVAPTGEAVRGLLAVLVGGGALQPRRRDRARPLSHPAVMIER